MISLKKMHIMLIPDIINLATNASLKAKINKVKVKILNIANLATTTTAPAAVENSQKNC